MEKVFGYIRVSTETQVQKGYGAEAQESAIRQYCKSNNFELIKVFKDLGISGTAYDRDGLAELIASFNGIQKVVVLNTSRLWRSDSVKALIKRELMKLKVDINSIEQPTYNLYTKDPNDFLINGIMELLDQYDRMTINLKLARGRKAKVKSGEKGCGEAPLGYKWKHEGTNKPIIVLDDETASIVKEIFHKYLELESIGKVKKYLDSKGYKTNRGKEFSAMSIRNILSNEFYVGKINWGNIEAQGQHQHIINKIIFGKVKALLKRNRKKEG